ncbi:hypothetical protein XY06_002027 [Salmonella enterica subsp. enterica]|nr:hypothetical protein [Salmonella enterica subsp. enterica serovar Paratyphi C]EEJ9044785.1 hypothetical protein [Salmonella enterica subsp. enterica]
MYNGGECRVAIASMKVLAFLYFYTLHTSSCLCVGYGLLGPSMGLALTGRRTRRSNLLPADLSLTPVTSLSMLLGTHSLAAFKQLELFWVYTLYTGANAFYSHSYF